MHLRMFMLMFMLLVVCGTKLPDATAHTAARGLALLALGLDPAEDAVHVEGVVALTPHRRTVVAGKTTVRAAAVERHPTDATRIVGHLPVPLGHPVVPGEGQRERSWVESTH
jgi:hypothetical protein